MKASRLSRNQKRAIATNVGRAFCDAGGSVSTQRPTQRRRGRPVGRSDAKETADSTEESDVLDAPLAVRRTKVAISPLFEVRATRPSMHNRDRSRRLMPWRARLCAFCA